MHIANKILHIYRDFNVAGGVPEQTRELVNAQSKEKSVYVICKTNRTTKKLYTGNIRLYDCNWSFWQLFNIIKTVINIDPDIIHISGSLIITQSILFLLLPKRLKKVTILSPHGVISDNGIRYRFGEKANHVYMSYLKIVYIKTVEKYLFHNCCAIHCQSQFEYNSLTTHFGNLRSALIHPVGVNKEWYHKKQLGTLENGITQFLYLGRLDIDHKGLDMILWASSLLVKANMTNFKVILAGSDVLNSRDVLNTMINELSLRNIVEVRGESYGHVKRSLLYKTRFLLAPFRFAGQSRICGEGIGSGIPLIVSREGNWGDWADKYKFGITVKLNIGSLYEGMKKSLLMDTDDYQHYVNNSYNYYKSIQWSIVAINFINYYNGVLKYGIYNKQFTPEV